MGTVTGKVLTALALAGTLAAGCASESVRDEPLQIGIDGVPLDMPALAEAMLDFRGEEVQSLVGTWKDRTFAAQCVFKGDGERLTVVFLAPQMRLATLRIARPRSIRYERSAVVPQALEPEYAIADAAFVNLPAEKLARALGPGWNVEDDGKRRTISVRGGDAVAEVERVDGAIRYRSLKYGYGYEVKKISGGGEFR